MNEVLNGSQPITQQTRDQIAQSDHDKLIELSVVLKTILEGQTRLETQIKDLIQGQATALASWEVKSDTVHASQDMRIRKLEELSITYLPQYQDTVAELKELKKEVGMILDNKSAVLGGWKGILFFAGAIAGILSAGWIIIQVISFFSCGSYCHAP